jgi:hypothetical protein
MTNTSKLRVAGLTASVIVSTIGAVGNLRRHGDHDEHDQSCRCFSSCTHCMWDAALGR